jgi:glycosyltransferase involved in cell wall biosynthesis
MPRHHIMMRLGRYFPIVWVEQPRGWREWWWRRGIKEDSLNQEIRPSVPNFSIYRPGRWLPKVYKPHFLDILLERLRLRRARHVLRRQGCSKTIMYVWRPELAPALDLLPHDLSCYHIDDEYSFSEVEQPLDDYEASVIGRVDQVIVHSPALLEKKGGINPRTICVPNGVDYHAYATPQAEPADLKAIPHPRIGYVGMIKKQLDFGLLVELARRHQNWSFVLVGPKGTLGDQAKLVQELERMPNVYFLGGKPINLLPAYTQHFDVCMMCYAINGYTKFIYPLKLHEYLATGRPVVGTPIRSLLDFSHVVTLARTPAEWSVALTAALEPSASSPEQIARRQQVARAHDWDRMAEVIARTLAECLGSGYREILEKAEQGTDPEIR